MQPSLRHAVLSVSDSMRTIGLRGSARQLSIKSSVKVPACIQCQFLTQRRRHFADDTKPKPPPTPLNPPPSTQDDDPSPSFPGHELPSATERRRSPTSKRLSNIMDHLQDNIFLASQRLNDLTGYSGIEALKASIAAQEAHAQCSQEAVRAARQTYKQTIADRAASQREVTTLLARKDTWTPVDLERFTSLYRSDHGNEQAAQEAATRLAEAERVAEQAANKLSTSILRRYHEEQIWSDKIRRMSTWGTWGLMGVNVLIFLVFQFGFEPWRRRRLVRGFEEKVREALDKEKERQELLAPGQGQGDGESAVASDEKCLDGVVLTGFQELEVEVDDSTKDPAPVVDALAAIISNYANEAGEEMKTRERPRIATGLGYLRRPDTWRASLLDLFSDRLVSLRKRDVTIAALEGAATGAAIGSLIMFMLRSK